MAAGDIEIIPLSGSTDGRPISVVGISGATATTIHTATSAPDELDLIWLYMAAGSDSPTVTLLWGGVGLDDRIDYGGAFSVNEVAAMVTGFPIRNGLTIKAYNTAGLLPNITGVVHRYHGVTSTPAAGFASTLPLSGSTDGKTISMIGATSTGTAVAVHTATATTGVIDLVTLYAVSSGAPPSGTVRLEWGGTGAADRLDIDVDSGVEEFVLLVDKFPIAAGLPIKAFSPLGDFTGGIIGYVERFNNG